MYNRAEHYLEATFLHLLIAWWGRPEVWGERLVYNFPKNMGKSHVQWKENLNATSGYILSQCGHALQ